MGKRMFSIVRIFADRKDLSLLAKERVGYWKPARQNSMWEIWSECFLCEKLHPVITALCFLAIQNPL